MYRSGDHPGAVWSQCGLAGGNCYLQATEQSAFVNFPFIGGSAGSFGQGPGIIGGLFGFPGFNAQIGTPTGGGGAHGNASLFPGMGSPVGSILPGIVLATTVIPCTALTGNCRPPQFPTPQSPITIPISFTVAPTCLPDAPFVSWPYGESSFNQYSVGAKIRLTGPHNPLGLAIIPFYRWYPDSANDASGWNQLQRGAGPGGKFTRGDFGVAGVVDARLSRHVNVSTNFTYIWNSNPTSEAMNGATLLDRPDEFHAGIGLDFPVNKHFQPIAEVRSTYYTGGKTPNAFNNNPVELIGGAKIYPKRWFGFGFWYRRHLNEQSESHFNLASTTTVTVNNLSGVFVPGRGIVIVPPFTVTGAPNGVPAGLRFSSDPNGFGVQFFAGHRHKRLVPIVAPNPPPVVAASASSSTITLPCQKVRLRRLSLSANYVIQLTPMRLMLTTKCLPPGVYRWQISGEGRNVTWI